MEEEPERGYRGEETHRRVKIPEEEPEGEERERETEDRRFETRHTGGGTGENRHRAERDRRKDRRHQCVRRRNRSRMSSGVSGAEQSSSSVHRDTDTPERRAASIQVSRGSPSP